MNPVVVAFTRFIVPPLIVNKEDALVKPKLGDAEEVLPTVLTFITPLDIVNEQGAAAVTSNRLAKFMVPPSIINVEVVAPPIELPAAVPTLKVPADILNNPDIVGEPVKPAIVALALFNHIPPVAGTV